MGLDLWKVTDQDRFGNYDLWEFLEEHGAEIVSQKALSVPVGAFRAALKAHEAGEFDIREEDIAFIKKELSQFPCDEEEETFVDLYTVTY
jgi:hypothetical protein